MWDRDRKYILTGVGANKRQLRCGRGIPLGTVHHRNGLLPHPHRGADGAVLPG